jgi:hypothetical protein
MAILDVHPVDKGEDERPNSQYLPHRNIPPVAPLKEVFIDSNPEKWTEECSQALQRARELATRLTSRALQRGLVVTEELDALRRPMADDLLRRLVEWLHIECKANHLQSELLHFQIILPQITLLEYFGGEPVHETGTSNKGGTPLGVSALTILLRFGKT